MGRWLIYIWSRVQQLSLDVVWGAWASGFAVAWMWDCTMPLIWHIALPLAVWVVYTADHLLDGWRMGEEATTARHRFHVKYRIPLSIAWALALGSCLTWVMYVAPFELRSLGWQVGGLVVLHLGLVGLVGSRNSGLLIKELGVAFVYAVGVWGGPWVICNPVFTWGAALLWGAFFLLGLLNLLIFSCQEFYIDLENKQSSWVQGIGLSRATWVSYILSGVICSLLLAVIFLSENTNQQWLAGIYGFIWALFTSMLIFPHTFKKGQRYRIWGDAAFLLSGLVVFLA